MMLVPPSLDEWLPQSHLSRFIADVVETQLDLSKFFCLVCEDERSAAV